MVISRRSLLLAGAAIPTAAYGQCVTNAPAVDACRGGVRNAAPAGATLDLNFMFPGSLDSRIAFTRASTATYTDASGTIQTAAVNQPRWDYDPVTHALRGVLIEPIVANVLLNSAVLGTQTTAALSANPFTLSFYGTGSITYSGAASGTLTGTGAYPQRVSRTFTPTAAPLTCTVTGSVLNAQLEQLGAATSWIPTTSGPVVRSNDVCSVTVAGWYDQNTQTILYELYNPVVPPGQIGGTSDGNFGNSFYIGPNTIASRAGAVTANGAALTVGAVNKVAGGMSVSIVKCCVNGGTVGSAVNAVLPPVATRLAIATDPWSLGGAMGGYVRRVLYWPRVLSDAEMQQVTT